MKKILIDVSSAMPGGGIMGNYVSGIGQATIGLVDAFNEMQEIPYEIELYASGFQQRNFDFSRWKYKGHKIPVPIKISNRYPFFEASLRKLFASCDLYHITTNYAATYGNEPFIVTIHDCTDMDKANSSDISDSNREIYLKNYQRVTQASKAIVTVSEFSKSEILKYFDVDSDKVIVNYSGVNRNKFKKVSDEVVSEVLKTYKLESPFFFACSCNRPRKNLITALRAFKQFLTFEPEHIFVAAWANPTQEIRSEFAKEISDGKILFLPFLSDEEIVALYNAASLSIYVSRKEGFGFPILESFACGTPIMTCRNSSLPEVGQDVAIYVGEDNVDEMVDVMRMFEKGSYDTSLFIRKSENVLSRFTWENTAKRWLTIYSNILK
ncbi:MAG: glycosyltransferase family 4 protein [Prevotella sp.]|nr:glycosyltransferase family 4 protein [Prevotella sp.]